MNEYQNIFSTGPAVYRNEAKCVRKYKGYRVFAVNGGYDIVRNGVCISQRCGHSQALLERIDSGEDLYTTPEGPRHAAQGATA